MQISAENEMIFAPTITTKKESKNEKNDNDTMSTLSLTLCTTIRKNSMAIKCSSGIKTMSVLSPLSHQGIRNRYLLQLGLVNKSKLYTQKGPNSTRFLKNSIRSQTSYYYEELKGDYGREQSTPGSLHLQNLKHQLIDEESVTMEMIKKKTQKKCSFNEVVTVLPIPKREHYSLRIQKLLWPSKSETVSNVSRNLIEFEAEHNDWTQVLEEENFYTCMETGQKIHPIHVCISEAEKLRQRNVAPYSFVIPQYLDNMHEKDTFSTRSKNMDSFLQISYRAASVWQEARTR